MIISAGASAMHHVPGLVYRFPQYAVVVIGSTRRLNQVFKRLITTILNSWSLVGRIAAEQRGEEVIRSLLSPVQPYHHRPVLAIFSALGGIPPHS